MAPDTPPPKKGYGQTPISKTTPTKGAAPFKKAQTPIAKVPPPTTGEHIRGQTPIGKVPPPKKP